MDDIIGHNKLDYVVDKADGFTETKSGQRKHKITNKGWEFLIKWKDGLQYWVPMLGVKEFFPIQLVEYIKLHRLEVELVFAW